jgi:hypothetical protein
MTRLDVGTSCLRESMLVQAIGFAAVLFTDRCEARTLRARTSVTG